MSITDKKINEANINHEIWWIKAKLKFPISDKERQSYGKRLAELQKQKEDK